MRPRLRARNPQLGALRSTRWQHVVSPRPPRSSASSACGPPRRSGANPAHQAKVAHGFLWGAGASLTCLVASCVVATAAASAQPVVEAPEAVSGGSYLLQFEPSAIADSVLADLILKLSLRIRNSANWPVRVVPAGLTVLSLVHEEYGIGADRPLTRYLLAGLIASSNQLALSEAIPSGTRLFLPPAPRLTTRAAHSKDYTQFISWSSPLVVLASTDRVWSKPNDVVRGQGDLSDASSWTVYGSSTELATLIPVAEGLNAGDPSPVIILPLAAQTKPDISPEEPATAAGALGTNEFVAPAAQADSASHSWTPGMVNAELSRVHFYLLDYFTPHGDESCAHGRKVLDVVRWTLKSLGIDVDTSALASSVMHWDLDFAHEPDTAAERMKKYSAKYSADNQATILDRIKAVVESKVDSTDLPYDAFYLRTLYSLAMTDTLAGVISMSFAAEPRSEKVFPESYGASSRVVVINAAMDAERNIDSTKVDPFREMLLYGRATGAIIVGGALGDTGWVGMYSKSGLGITVVGQAAGYSGDCISPEDKGTSFAAPEIGTLAFLAMAHLRGSADRVAASEMRHRIELSSRIRSRYVNHVASAGLPQLALLVRGPGAHAIRHDGRIDDVVIDESQSSITLKYPDGRKLPLRIAGAYSFYRGDVPAFYIVGNLAYYYDQSMGMWTSKTYSDLQIGVDQNGTVARWNATQFAQRYAGLVIF